MSEQASILREAVDRLLTDRLTREVRESAEAGEFPTQLWEELEANGLTVPLVPEEQGGIGATWEEAWEIVRLAGRHAAPVPLAETVLASWLLSQAGIEVPAGPLTVAGQGLSLRSGDDGPVLSGTVAKVPWGRMAGHVVAIAAADGEFPLVLAKAAEASVVEDLNMAREPRDTLGFEDAPVVASAPHPLGADAVEKYGAMLRAAQMAGALEYLLAQSVAYANERPQFGRPIGKFQAIQQQLAGLACETAAARTAAENAFRVAGLGGNADPGFEIAAAKVRAGEAATAGPSIAHQVHGAIGFTYEHNLHFATRRLWSWRAEFGTAQRWARQLGRQALERGGENLWADVTARP